MERLQGVLYALGNDKNKLVIDLSCRRKDDKWFVATNKWQTITDFELNQGTSCLSFQPFCNFFRSGYV
jgi:phosphoribosylformimino-5-aminoimidazole carboxamide ribotide isomerase